MVIRRSINNIKRTLPDFTKFHIFVLVSIFYLPYIICSSDAVSMLSSYTMLCPTRVIIIWILCYNNIVLVTILYICIKYLSTIHFNSV